MSSMRSTSSSTRICNPPKRTKPRRGDHHAGSRAQALQLRAFGKSAHHQSRGAQLLAAQQVVLLRYLRGQFARGQQHQGGNSRRVLAQ